MNFRKIVRATKIMAGPKRVPIPQQIVRSRNKLRKYIATSTLDDILKAAREKRQKFYTRDPKYFDDDLKNAILDPEELFVLATIERSFNAGQSTRSRCHYKAALQPDPVYPPNGFTTDEVIAAVESLITDRVRNRDKTLDPPRFAPRGDSAPRQR
jgi:hypothetical protein